jgi:hypothetical protein
VEGTDDGDLSELILVQKRDLAEDADCVGDLVRPSILTSSSMMQEISSRSLESIIADQCGKTLLLRTKLVRSTSIERRSLSRIIRVLGSQSLYLLGYGVGEVDGAEKLLVVVIVADAELVGEAEDGAFILHVADDVGDVGDLACAKKAVRTVLGKVPSAWGYHGTRVARYDKKVGNSWTAVYNLL